MGWSLSRPFQPLQGPHPLVRNRWGKHYCRVCQIDRRWGNPPRKLPEGLQWGARVEARTKIASLGDPPPVR